MRGGSMPPRSGGVQGEDGLLAEVRRPGSTVTRQDVVVWAHLVAKQVNGGHRGFNSWADAVAEFRAWGVQRGVIRIFAS